MGIASNTLVIDGNKLSKICTERKLAHGSTLLAIGKSDNYIAGCITKNQINKTAMLLLTQLFDVKYDDIKPDVIAEKPKAEKPTVVTEKTDIEPIIDKLTAIIYAQQKQNEELMEKLNDITVSINRLGNVLMQSMEYQKTIMGDADEIKGCVRQIKNYKR